MKNFVIVIFLSMISLIGISQKYTPFDFSNGVWICGYFTKGGVFEFYGTDYVREEVKFYCQGDTLINDTIYRKLFYIGYAKPTMTPQKNISGYYGAIRNDSIHKRVWFKNNNNYGILYDFNLDVGDSIRYSCSESEAKINSIDSALYCNTYHKKYNYIDVNNIAPSFIVEGIGSSGGLIPVNCLTSFSYLICYSERNNAVCDTCKTPTAIKETEINKLQIYPNPTNDVLKVISEDPILSIEVTDFLGKLIYINYNINNERAEIMIQQNGIFIIKIKTSNKTIIRKFIKK
jgi:hypothetical protein